MSPPSRYSYSENNNNIIRPLLEYNPPPSPLQAPFFAIIHSNMKKSYRPKGKACMHAHQVGPATLTLIRNNQSPKRQSNWVCRMANGTKVGEKFIMQSISRMVLPGRSAWSSTKWKKWINHQSFINWNEEIPHIAHKHRIVRYST